MTLILQIALGVGIGIIISYFFIRFFSIAIKVSIFLALLTLIILTLIYVFSELKFSWEGLERVVIIVISMFAVYAVISIPVMLHNLVLKRFPRFKLFIYGENTYSSYNWMGLRFLIMPLYAFTVALIPLALVYMLGYLFNF